MRRIYVDLDETLIHARVAGPRAGREARDDLQRDLTAFFREGL